MLENTRSFGLAAQIRNWFFSVNIAQIHKIIFIDGFLISFWSLEALKIFKKIDKISVWKCYCFFYILYLCNILWFPLRNIQDFKNLLDVTVCNSFYQMSLPKH